MTKRYLIPALVTGVIAVILTVLVTISTPTTLSDNTRLDFARSSNLNGIVDLSPGSNQKRPIGGVVFGTWGYCTTTNGTSDTACFKKSHGYSVKFGINPDNQDTSARSDVTIGSSWTRGLAVHVVAFIAALAGLVLTAIPKQICRLAATIVTALATLLALIAFAIDIALYVYVMRQMKKIAPSASSMPGVGFYMALIAIPFALVASAFNFLNWRHEKLDNVVTEGYDYPLPTTNSHYKEETAVSDSTTPYASPSAQKVLSAYEESKTN
ncbi:pali-domain-containing protein [Testicularia cyperi]|uniref:Pali-domain-containing protein n=1 Tax=Testicularia cyperi TaxID=1882483 RepID=A0A317XK51_9BASI|nr:pali-domain-containing protein [Testicularia cyperi]